MNSKEFKSLFGSIAKENDYLQAFGGWYKESPECIAVLELQKSKYGDYYMLNIKIFIQGSFDTIYSPTKELIKSPMGDIGKQIIDDVLSFDKPMPDELRRERLKELFSNTIIPFVSNLMTKANIIDLASKGEIMLLSSVKKELEKLMK
ncbi:DUF4304 domain-containing protein [Chryseobacterium rhizosphaerae]|uniref:DUF4304 domain-containing protein n=1 Tax=Chryseobacterium rhizosphaerae TaxID=395937 RepID=A0ABX9IEU3_9FLAO|nr:DUF4304 domain-containing protein [Chryseobacterium rhizosphaerae]MDC8101943.1 DUF4304 domain-containing protein [Chryseobacterium rhizosphaerae]REC71012.1 hypothetical protein DRF57_21280 [Chryseobacterium rhizosphaerae]GEN69443.1 hypothetical protein CRH01_40110 [Chryseobacterium rhizosphaerae]